jgi:hypothetical protein
VKDIFPGPQGSHPSHLVVFNGVLYFQAEGIDTTWQLPVDHTDHCGGFRQSSFDSRVFFAVSEDNVWEPDRTYDCPTGYHWASTEEAFHLFPAANDESGEERVYWNQCGWDEFVWGGKARRHFRFQDSSATGAYKDVSKYDSTRPDVDRFGRVVAEFAGIVCVAGDVPFVPSGDTTQDCRCVRVLRTK